ncbi:hypothetical protein [Streptomyces sp. bgisy153]|uniref:hypothetical protein n=1 Tax=Streptomyces sp. bgisy153 TaxID=3413793 RepID=UPI003D73D52C
MTASSQNLPGALPPETTPTRPVPLQTAAAFATFGVAVPAPAGDPADAPTPPMNPDVPHHLRARAPEPDLPECFTCGTRKKALQACPDGRRYDSGAQVLYCAGCVPPPAPVRGAEAALEYAMKKGLRTPRDLAYAQHDTGILFDPARAQDIFDAGYEQARAEDQAELEARGGQLREAREQLAVVGGAQRKVNAVLREIEGRPGDYYLPVAEIAAAVEYGTTPYDRMPPMTLTWTGTVNIPGPGDTDHQAVIQCCTPHGTRAVVAVDGDDRTRLASLLGLEARDIHAPCPRPGCGEDHDWDPSDPNLFGWSRLEIAALADGPRWYCSDMCVFDARARARHDLAADDQAAATDPHQQAPTPPPPTDTAAEDAADAGARCVRCGCTEDRPCEGGCAWVPGYLVVDLCSACATPAELAAAGWAVSGE